MRLKPDFRRGEALAAREVVTEAVVRASYDTVFDCPGIDLQSEMRTRILETGDRGTPSKQHELLPADIEGAQSVLRDLVQGANWYPCSRCCTRERADELRTGAAPESFQLDDVVDLRASVLNRFPHAGLKRQCGSRATVAGAGEAQLHARRIDPYNFNVASMRGEHGTDVL